MNDSIDSSEDTSSTISRTGKTLTNIENKWLGGEQSQRIAYKRIYTI